MAGAPPDSIHLSRHALLEALLRWEGRLRRRRVQELFGFGAIRASQLIAEFAQAHPDWTTWSTKERSHLATSAFYGRPSGVARTADADSLARYLVFTGVPPIVRQGADDGQVVWAAFRDLAVPRPALFARLHEAATLVRQVDVTYRSLQHPEPHALRIEPHSLVRAGRRWHVRAFSQTHGEFRDFVLGRIAAAKVLGDSATHSAADDAAWNTWVPVRLQPHPALTVAQQTLIQHELLGDAAARVETCRGPLVHYFIQDQRAALDVATERPPEYQLAVVDPDKLAPWLLPH